MSFLKFPFIGLAAFLLATRAHAKPVISEVHWAGSDLSTSDEWLEVTDDGTGPASMSGWTLTKVSGGTESVVFTFPAGTVLHPDEFIILSHFAAGQSRLLAEPAFVIPSLTLPNTQLQLRLRNAAGELIDEVDDGVGAPFAGENSTSPIHKSSMERIDLTQPGNITTNWITASKMSGLDEGSPIFATPGFAYQQAISTSSSSAVSSTSSSSVSSASSVSLASSSTSSSSAAGNGCAVLSPSISIQSGTTQGVDKVTLNIQIIQSPSTGVQCVVDFGDGFVSSSCNPPSHTFDEAGSFEIVADVKNACGDSAQRTLGVTVQGKSSSSAAVVSSNDDSIVPQYFVVLPTGTSAFAIAAVLPNPDGKDTDKEWVDIQNVANASASLEGWSLRLPHAKKSKFTFGLVGFSAREAKRVFASDMGMTFNNAAGELSLIDPQGKVVSTVAWKDVRDGVVIRPQTMARGTVTATATHIVDGDTFDVRLLDGSAITERIRLIGIDAPELHSNNPNQMMLAKRSRDFLRERIEGETITLDIGADPRDAYGRVLAYATTEEGDSIQEMLLREGLASAYLRFAFAKESEFIGYQREAQEAGAGVWGVGENSEKRKEKREQ